MLATSKAPPGPDATVQVMWAENRHGSELFARGEKLDFSLDCGGAQGCPLVTFAAACSTKVPIEALHDTLTQHGGSAIADADDMYAVGPASAVWTALAILSDTLSKEWGLELVESKCQVLAVRDHPGRPAEMHVSGALIYGVFQPGTKAVGVPIGTPACIKHFPERKVAALVSDNNFV